MDLKNELTIRSIKIVDIAYTSILYTTIAVLGSLIVDKFMSYFDNIEFQKKTTFSLFVEIYTQLEGFRDIIEKFRESIILLCLTLCYFKRYFKFKRGVIKNV